MNEPRSSYLILKGLTIVLLLLQCISGDVYSIESEDNPFISPTFKSPQEFTSHTQGVTCSVNQCHADIKRNKISMHEPVMNGQCIKCHIADKYPNRYGLIENQRKNCAGCHKKTEDKFQSSSFVHGPIKNGDCTSCHNPHRSDQPFLLRQPYDRLCKSCHKIEGLYTGSFVHKPVKDGNCGLCHDPHVSNYKSRLVDVGLNLCVSCHEEFVAGMTQSHIHAPLLKSGCSDCHDSHSGDNKLRLKKSKNELCFSCHEEKKNEVQQYTVKHKPALEGLCTECHSPHFSAGKNLLLDNIDRLCYKCHKEAEKRSKRKFKHGPVVQGNCTACHNPHGSDNAFILRLPFPHKFYSRYEEDTYSLCFLCHVESLVTAEQSETITDFRNGKTNLHRLHVKQEKGRTCRACHDVHASEQEGRIRDSFPYGTMDMPLEFYKTSTGGFCVPGCHKAMTYDRLNMVDNIR